MSSCAGLGGLLALRVMLVDARRDVHPHHAFFFFFTLVTGPRRSLSLKLSDTRVKIRAHLGTTAHFCEVVVLKLRAVQGWEGYWRSE